MNEPASMDRECLDRRSRRALRFAHYEASRSGRKTIGSEDLLLGISRLGDESIRLLLEHYGLSPDRLLAELRAERRPAGAIAVTNALPLSDNCRRVFEASSEEARSRALPRADSLCLVLGMLRIEESRARAILLDHGVVPQKIESDLAFLKSDGSIPASPDEPEFATAFGRELVAQAAGGLFDPLIGREVEMTRMVKVLSRRLKNNPVLVGEPGVGKTAIVEGLAQRIHAGEVPPSLRRKRLFSLDMSAIVAGTKFRGEFEERFKKLLDGLARSDDWIVFVDEVHTLVGAGSTEGSLDAANILKRALSRGEICCIGATTAKEYRRHIERDRALQRRFQEIVVRPPSEDETLQILDGVKRRYEEFHRVRYAPQALEEAVRLSVRYIQDRQLPDKAIDLVDEAAAWARLEASEGVDGSELRSVVPVERRHVDEVLADRTGVPASRLAREERLALANMEKRLEKRVIGQSEAIAALSQALRRSRLGIGDHRRPIGCFMFVGPSGVGKTELARCLAELLFDSPEALVHLDMSEYGERHTVSKLIGSPPGYVGFQDGGQLTERIRRQPYSVVLFDEVEKAHPDLLNVLLQVLEAGRLTDADGNQASFRQCVLLLTSNVGGRILADDSRAVGFGEWHPRHSASGVQEEILGRLRRVFRPEFLNRLDSIIPFRALSPDALGAIADLMIADVNELLARRGVELELADEARGWLVERAGRESGVGARALRRTIDREIVDRLAELLLEERPSPITGPIEVTVADGRISLDFPAAADAGPAAAPARMAIQEKTATDPGRYQ